MTDVCHSQGGCTSWSVTCLILVLLLHNGRPVSVLIVDRCSLLSPSYWLYRLSSTSWMSLSWNSSWVAARLSSQRARRCGSKTWPDTSTTSWTCQRASPPSATTPMVGLPKVVYFRLWFNNDNLSISRHHTTLFHSPSQLEISYVWVFPRVEMLTFCLKGHCVTL